MIPSSLKIGGFTVSVCMDKETQKLLDEKCIYGQYSSLQLQIRLKNDLIPELFNYTFLHELIHAIDNIYCSDKLDEGTVNGIANGLLQVFEQLGIRFSINERKR